MSDKTVIHVVDDYPAMRDSLAFLLDVNGFQPQTFESANAFLSAAAIDAPGCVVSDIRMPGMNGIELRNRIQAVSPEQAARIVFVTGGALLPHVRALLERVPNTWLEKPIEVEALRGISFSVRKGEFVSVVGPSGSGKSTLFYLLGGLTRADGGSVVLDGDDLASLSDAERTRMRKRKIGFVFQKFNLLPTLDARANILIAREISGNGSRDPAFFDRITDLLGLTSRLGHRPAELSGGEQQRVALARALINKPAVVLADEPTGNLDSKNSDIVLGMLRKSNQELGQTVLMITHNPQAATYGDRIIHMRDGQVVNPEDDPQWARH